MAVCPKCGHENNAGGLFCAVCGVRMAANNEDDERETVVDQSIVDDGSATIQTPTITDPADHDTVLAEQVNESATEHDEVPDLAEGLGQPEEHTQAYGAIDGPDQTEMDSDQDSIDRSQDSIDDSQHSIDDSQHSIDDSQHSIDDSQHSIDDSQHSIDDSEDNQGEESLPGEPPDEPTAHGEANDASMTGEVAAVFTGADERDEDIRRESNALLLPDGAGATEDELAGSSEAQQRTGPALSQESTPPKGPTMDDLPAPDTRGVQSPLSQSQASLTATGERWWLKPTELEEPRGMVEEPEAEEPAEEAIVEQSQPVVPQQIISSPVVETARQTFDDFEEFSVPKSGPPPAVMIAAVVVVLAAIAYFVL